MSNFGLGPSQLYMQYISAGNPSPSSRTRMSSNESYFAHEEDNGSHKACTEDDKRTGEGAQFTICVKQTIVILRRRSAIHVLHTDLAEYTPFAVFYRHLTRPRYKGHLMSLDAGPKKRTASSTLIVSTEWNQIAGRGLSDCSKTFTYQHRGLVSLCVCAHRRELCCH
jgi:hypothetical protein